MRDEKIQYKNFEHFLRKTKPIKMCVRSTFTITTNSRAPLKKTPKYTGLVLHYTNNHNIGRGITRAMLNIMIQHSISNRFFP